MFGSNSSRLAAAAVLFIGALTARAALITSIVSSANENPEDDSAIVQSISTASATYTAFIPGSAVTTGSNSRFWAQFGSDPGSRNAAVTDLNLTTGVFNPGGATIHSLAAAPSPGDILYLFGGQDAPNSIIAVNAAGSPISSPLSASDYVLLLPVTVNNNGNTPFITRTVGGVLLAVNDLVFTGGNTLADVAGFTVTNGNWDPIDFGLTSIPEPATLALLTAAAFLLLPPRKRQA